MLLLLSMVSMAMAAPQYYPIYNHGYPLYQPSYPIMYPGRVAPGYPYPSAIPAVDSRLLITHSAFMSVAGALEADTTTTPALAVTGTVEFHQNPATGSNSKYKIYLNGADMANKKYTIGVNADCTAAGTTLTDVTAPFFLINGFWVSGISDTMNIDAADSKTSVKGMFVTVSDSTGVIGCTKAALV